MEKKIPGALWISIAVLGAVTVIISTRFFFPGRPRNLAGETAGTGQA